MDMEKKGYIYFMTNQNNNVLYAKEITLLELFFQALNCLHCTLICRTEFLMKGGIRYFKILIIVGIKSI